MPTATLTSKGQITIPRQVRAELRLEAGDKLEFLIGEEGTVRMRRLGGSVKELGGLLKRPGKQAVSIEEMNRAIADYVADRDRLTRSGSYRLGGADFADYLIGYRNLASGCSHTVSFDSALAKAPGFTLV